MNNSENTVHVFGKGLLKESITSERFSISVGKEAKKNM